MTEHRKIELYTPRLIIRALAPDDAQAMYAYRSDPAVCLYQGWEPGSVEEIAAFIERQDLGRVEQPDAWIQLGLYLRQDDTLVGDLGIHTLTDVRQAELGITLSPAHQRRGLATEALRAALGFLFEQGARHRVVASVDPRNEAVVALLEKVGMRREAHHVESLWFKGEWVDDVIYAMLEREHTASQARGQREDE